MATPKYAWVIAFGCFLCGMTTMGGIVVFSYCMLSIAADFGLTVADLAICSSVYTLFCNGLSWAAGLVNDRVGPRWTMGIGVIGNSCSFLLVPILAHSRGMIVILFCLAGAFASTLVGSCMPKLISDWFAPHHRGKANLCYVLGPTITGVLMGIVIPILLTSADGWRTCFYCISGFTLCCGIVFVLIVRNTPADKGTHAFGYSEEEAAMLVEALKVEKEKSTSTGAMIKKVLSNKVTWTFGICYTLWMLYFSSVQTYKTPALMAVFDPTLVGAINSATAALVIVSQIAFASLSDYYLARKYWIAILQFLQSGMMIGLWFILNNAAAGNPMATGPFVAYMLVYGIFGGQGALMNTINTEVFPPSLRATGPAVVATITMIGSTFGPLICAAVMNAMGGNTAAFLIVAGPAQVIAAIVMLIAVPKTGGKYGDPSAIAEAEAALGEDAVAAATAK